MRQLFLFVVVVLASRLLACSDSAPPGSCADNAECDAGSVCTAGSCAQLCATQRDCGSGRVCLANVCQLAQGTNTPVIQTITGNDPGAIGLIRDGMVIGGERLAGSVFELQSDASALALTVRSLDDTAAELVLPADIRSGDYVLVATNQAGSAQAPVQLQLPELTGTMLLERLNEPGTSGQVDVGLLPVGTGSAQVAPGDHTHTDLDYLPLSGGTVSGSLVVGSELSAGAVSITSSLHVGAPDSSVSLRVGVGFTYSKTNAAAAQLTPRCECDLSATLADCGTPASVTNIQELSDHTAGTCYDHWDVGGAGATQFTKTNGLPPLPGLVVTPTGGVGIGTATPASRLHIAGTSAAHADFLIGGHAITLRGVRDAAAYSPRLPYIQFRENDNADGGAGTRALYFGWGNTDDADPYIDMALENGYDLSITGGRVGIARNNPATALHVSGAIAATDWIGAGCESNCETAGGYAILYPNGNINYTGSLNSVSDARLKRDIQPLTGALDKVMALRGVTYERVDHPDATRRDIGLVAQEVERVLPEIVNALGQGDTKGVNYLGLVPVLVEALKEQQRQNRELEQRLRRLERSVGQSTLR